MAIPLGPGSNMLRWRHTSNGYLSIKEVYKFLNTPCQSISWIKDIWNNDILPSKSILLWKILHSKVATAQRYGIALASMCSLCNAQTEAVIHFFVNVLMLRIFRLGLTTLLTFRSTAPMSSIFLILYTLVGSG